MDESAYAHLGNAQQVIRGILDELPPDAVNVLVARADLAAIYSRIEKARDIIKNVHHQATGAHNV